MLIMILINEVMTRQCIRVSFTMQCEAEVGKVRRQGVYVVSQRGSRG